MKKPFLFLFTAALLVSASASQAQTKPQARHLEKYLKQASHMDASLAARGINASVTVPGLSTTHDWSNGQWRNGFTKTYTYNAQAKPTQIIYADSATGTPTDRELLTYNAQGKVTEYMRQVRNGSTYVNSSREVSAYDAQGRETLYTGYNWQNNAWVINYSSRSNTVYNAANVLTSLESEQLNTANNVWMKQSRVLFTVDASNRWSEVIYQDWLNGAYVNDGRTHNITWYNWAALEASYLEEQAWDGSAWVDTDRATITYQPNGSYVEVQQKKQGSTWVNDDRYTWTLDANGNVILDQGEEWVNNAWALNFAYRYLLAYTPANVLRRSVEQTYRTGAYTNSQVTTYSNFVTLASRRATGLAAAAAVYPNPTAGVATFKLSGLTQAQPLQAEVLNPLGQVVRTLHLQPRQGTVEQELDLRQQPAGLYLVRLHTTDGTVVKQVVKQ